jgi:hypothetical protein
MTINTCSKAGPRHNSNSPQKPSAPSVHAPTSRPSWSDDPYYFSRKASLRTSADRCPVVRGIGQRDIHARSASASTFTHSESVTAPSFELLESTAPDSAPLCAATRKIRVAFEPCSDPIGVIRPIRQAWPLFAGACNAGTFSFLVEEILRARACNFGETLYRILHRCF